MLPAGFGFSRFIEHVLPGLRSTNEDEVGSDRPYSAPKYPLLTSSWEYLQDTIKGGWTTTYIKCLQMNFLHTVNIHGQLALEVKLTCEILEEKSAKVGDVTYEMTLKGQGRVQWQLDSFTCGFIAEIMPPWHCLFWLGRFSLAESNDYVEFFFRAMREAPGRGMGAVRKDKGGTRPGIHRPPHLLLKPWSTRPAGRIWCWFPHTGHGGWARKTCKIIWDETRWLVLNNELMNIKWKTVTESLENEY